MTDRSVVTRFEAKIDGYLGGVAKMSGATEKFAKSAASSATKHKADWDKIGKAAIVGGAAIGATVVMAAKQYAEFEKAMSGVAAVSGANATQLKALGVAAREAGKSTVFSAMEAAQAEGELAKAGVSVADIMGGALAGSLNLAAAGQIDLAKAAEISAQAMNIFNKEGSDVGHIADVLTAGANKSAAGVDDLGMALQQGGLVAKQTGLTLEDTVGTLAAFADNALKGSDAGTSLKTMLQRLNPQSEEAATLMDELNLRAYDAQGNFVGVAKYAGMLQTALKGMSAEQRNAALSTLFGSDAVRGANVLMEQGEAGIRQYIAAVDDKGAAERMASRQTDNLIGDIEKLKGALQDAFIGAGEGGNAGIRALVQDVTSLIDKFGQLPPSTQANIVKFAALASGLLLVSGGAIKATTSILAMKASMDAAGLSGARLAAVTKGIGMAAAVIAVAAVSVELRKMIGEAEVATVKADQLSEALSVFATNSPASALRDVSGAMADLFRDQGGWLQAKEDYVTAAEAMDRFAISAKDALGTDLTDKLARLQSGGQSVSKFEKQVRQLDAGLAEMVSNGHADQAKVALEKLLSQMDPKVAEAARAKFTEYAAALDETAVAADGAASTGVELSNTQKASAVTAEAAAAAEANYAESLKDVESAITRLGGGLRAEQQAIADSTEALKEAQKVAKDAKATRAEDEASLRGLSQKYLEVSASQVEMQRGAGEISATMQQNRADFIKTAVAMGYNATFAEQLADNYGLIPEKVATLVSAVGAETASEQVTNLNTVILGLNGKTVTVKEAGKAKPSKDNVLELDASILGLKGKTVSVQELGANAAGERVVKFQGKIYTLKGKTVTVSETGATAATGRVGTLQYTINGLQGKTVTVTTRYVTTGTKPTGGRSTAGGITKDAATGGAIYGPGTGTSDSIPARLSNGEHVFTASDVQKAGGQGAIYAMRAAIQAGELRFAKGGEVDISAKAAPFAGGGQVMSTSVMNSARPAAFSPAPVVRVTPTAGTATALIPDAQMDRFATLVAQKMYDAQLAAQRGAALATATQRKGNR